MTLYNIVDNTREEVVPNLFLVGQRIRGFDFFVKEFFMSTAILIDGAFFKKRHRRLFGKFDAEELADKMIEYALHRLKKSDEELYRIFYYDCAPSSYEGHYPVSKKNIKFRLSDQTEFQLKFLEHLKSKRKVAIRLGELQESGWTLKKDALEDLLKGKLEVSALTDEHYRFALSQKGVDMKMGLDIAALSYKRLVSQILLIAGDSDFVPAAKLARKEGIDFVLDPMKNHIKPSLHEHVDGIIDDITLVQI